MSKKNKLGILKALGLTVLGGSALVACGNANQNTNNNYSGYTNGLPLVAENVHMQKGEHNYVITEQFYEYLTDDILKKNQDMAINGLKEAYSNLDKYTSSLNINLCTTVETLANEYGIKKVDSIGEQDIALYMTNDNLANNALTKTSYNYDSTSKEMKNLSITFKKETTFSVWKLYNNLKELTNPYNTVAYTNALRTGLETMGFRYFNDNKSVMNDFTEDSPKDLTDYDIELLDKYCVTFYNAETTLKKSANNVYGMLSYSDIDDELGM